MLILRSAQTRGYTTLSWLQSYHTFSFADYYDPAWMSFGPLRVINEDVIAKAQGFGLHPHRDMEIITYVISGSLKHEDSLGNGSVIRPGEIQRMSAGTGIRHSEYNADLEHPLHLLQIWIMPAKKGLTPSYEQKAIQHVPNQWILIGAPQSTAHTVTINQQVKLYVAYLDAKQEIAYPLDQRQAWMQVIDGQLMCNDYSLNEGDGVGLQEEYELRIHSLNKAQILLFIMD